MNKRLRMVATVEAVVFVGVLVTYLVRIAAALRDVSRRLRLVSVGVRAIEKQFEPLRDQIDDINRNLDRATSLLRSPASRP
jgi:hypothetical protein